MCPAEDMKDVQLAAPSPTNREKMILLLLILTSSAAALEVKVTQSSYQAEENHNITLEWTFNRNTKTEDIYVLCEHLNKERDLGLYCYYAGVELSEFVDEGFSGRVQSDTDALREGRIRLQLSRLRTEDSGRYVCDVRTESGVGSASCDLRVSAAAAETHTDRPALSPEPDTGRWTGERAGLIATGVEVLLVLSLVFIYFMMTKRKNVSASAQKQSISSNRTSLNETSTFPDVVQTA